MNLLFQEVAERASRQLSAVGGGGINLVHAVNDKTLGQSLGLLLSQGGQGVGIVDGVAVADVVQKHGHISLKFDCI
jgi:hypothetical protein